jgi:putative FmdB family regulatory protein
MANYDYRCKGCARIATLTISMTEYNPEYRPECDKCGEPMKRLFNGHMAIKLRVKTGAKGQPYYGSHGERERRMNAARKAANPGAY